MAPSRRTSLDASTLAAMSAQREELQHLVDELSDEEVPTALALLRARARARRPAGTWPPRWFGAAQAREPDISERVDEILRGELGEQP
jgi:anti-sigma factor RsiW